jgi:hypothetical protein
VRIADSLDRAVFVLEALGCTWSSSTRTTSGRAPRLRGSLKPDWFSPRPFIGMRVHWPAGEGEAGQLGAKARVTARSGFEPRSPGVAGSAAGRWTWGACAAGGHEAAADQIRGIVDAAGTRVMLGFHAGGCGWCPPPRPSAPTGPLRSLRTRSSTSASTALGSECCRRDLRLVGRLDFCLVAADSRCTQYRERSLFLSLSLSLSCYEPGSSALRNRR